MQERSDQEWVRQLKQEDEQAVIDLWEKLFVWAFTVTRRYNHDEDIGRDGAMAAYRRITQRGIYQYKFQGPFLGFCRRILVNEVNRRLKPTPIFDDITDPATPQPLVVDPEPTADATTIRTRLQQCMDELKPREQEVISLIYLKEMAPQDAADSMGIARNNTNVIAYRARGKLLTCLEGQGYKSSADMLSL